MPRNGSGTYVLPAGQPVVSGTGIASAPFNTLTNDLATALTKSICTDGQTPMLAALNMNTNKVTGVATGTASTDGVNLAQMNAAIQLSASIISDARNLSMTKAAASSIVTYTAAELILKTTLGGQNTLLSNVNLTCDVSTTGAGGMDSGAPPISGYIDFYAIFGAPSSISIIGITSTGQAPEFYGGLNMPVGYTESALLGILPTDSSGNIVASCQIGRKVKTAARQAFTTTTATGATPVAVSIVGAVPASAKLVNGLFTQTSTSTSNLTTVFYDFPGAVFVGQQYFFQFGAVPAQGQNGNFYNLALSTSQSLNYAMLSTAGTTTLTAYITEYEF